MHFNQTLYFFIDLLRQYGMEDFIKAPLLTLETSVCLMRGLSSLANEKGSSVASASKAASRSRVVLRHVLVVDLRGLALTQVLDTGVIRLATQLASLHEAHYPETLSEAVLISSRQTAYITRMALSLVKPFLAERTRNKIRLVSDGPDLEQQLAAGNI